MLPSTGGSDEALVPKPHSSGTAHTLNALPTDKKSTTTSSAQDPPVQHTLNVNIIQLPNNPLKDFEPAKFASKTHGLITSYAANTHQGI